MRDRSVDHAAALRSGSPPPRRSQVKLTPGPHGKSDEDDDWGEWTHHGHRRRDRLSHADRRRSQSPSAPPGRNTAASNSRIDNQPPTVGLIQLRVCTPSASLGSHIFLLRSGCEVEEIAIRINDVLYYTLPSIAALVYPDPTKWKQSWESASEFAADRLPRHNPGPWTAEVLRDISREFGISPAALPEQLSAQLGVLEKCWPYIRKNEGLPLLRAEQEGLSGQSLRDHLPFEPRRRLPDNFRTQSISTFYWAHNTDIKSAISILKDEELIRPSKWLEDPSPNGECTNWNDVWIPPVGFYCRGSLRSNDAAVKSAAQFGGIHSSRPLCIGGKSRLRQEQGGTYADIAASHYHDCIHSKDGRWKLRSSIAVPSYVGMFW